MSANLVDTVTLTAAAALAGLVVTALWRLGAVLVGLPAALNSLTELVREMHRDVRGLEDRVSRLEAGVAA